MTTPLVGILSPTHASTAPRFSPVVTLRRQLAEKEAELRHVRAEFNTFRVKPDELKEQNLIYVKENKCLRKVSVIDEIEESLVSVKLWKWKEVHSV